MVGHVAVFAGVLAIDFGRASLLRTQMQNRADAGAMAAAVYLDGTDGARGRASAVAMQATQQYSFIPSTAAELTVDSVNFYREIKPAKIAATSDADSKFIEVNLNAQTMDSLFMPVLNFLTGGTGDGDTILQATATAQPAPYICHAPPLMLCDFAEVSAVDDLRLPQNAGRQVRLKEPQSQSSPWAPGNFGLLALPNGSSGASAIAGALAAVQPQDCYSLDVTTAPGNKTNQIKNGMNARFDKGGYPHPAPNVINYPRDQELLANPNAKLGSGTWDLNGYWAGKHGGPPPADLAGASRYQTYLFELGVSYARNGRQTAYPLPNGVPAGFTLVVPPGADVPSDPSHPADNDKDGVPGGAPAPNGALRRVAQVAQIQCFAENVHGQGTYPTNGNYIEAFITEEVRDPPQAAIYGEVIRGLTPAESPDFHANVKLVD